jgi:hypothetical protein
LRGRVRREDLIERARVPCRNLPAHLRGDAIPLVVGRRGEAGGPLPLVPDLREQPGGDGVLILDGKLLGLGDRVLPARLPESFLLIR